MRAHELCKLCSSFVINFSELGYWYWITVCIAGRWNKLLRSKTINSYNNIYIYICGCYINIHIYVYIQYICCTAIVILSRLVCQFFVPTIFRCMLEYEEVYPTCSGVHIARPT